MAPAMFRLSKKPDRPATMPCPEPGAGMRRREFMTMLGGAAAAWPLAASAQQQPAVGFLHAASAAPLAHLAAAFRHGLNEVGYVEGRNATIDYRWAEGQYDRLSELAAHLKRRGVAVIFASGPPAALAAKAVAATTPIVFVQGVDPVTLGFAASLNRPGGNATGVYLFSSILEPKKVELLHQLVPRVQVIGALVNSTSPNAEIVSNGLQTAARTLGLEIHLATASSEHEIDAAVSSIVQRKAGALVVANDPYFTARRDQLVALSARYALPTLYSARETAASGGLVSYGNSLADAHHQAGVYAGRILKGEKPGDLPIIQPTKFELVINLKTAKTLGLSVPQTLLVAADEVIE